MNALDADRVAMIHAAISSLPRWRRWWAEWSFRKRGEAWQRILSAYASVDRVLCGRLQTPTEDWQPGLLVATDRSLLFLWFYLSTVDLGDHSFGLGPDPANMVVPDLGLWET